MTTDQNSSEQFLFLSVALTGFDEAELLGTGLLPEYQEQLVNVIGKAISQELWTIAQNLADCDDNDRESAIRRDLLASPKFGPIARNIIQLWYWGSWIELPPDWREQYGINDQDVTHFISAKGYQEGLVWKAMSTHPQGAKQGGFGSWSLPPRRRSP